MIVRRLDIVQFIDVLPKRRFPLGERFNLSSI